MAFVDKNLRTEPMLSDNNYLDIFTPKVSEEFESQLREGYERLFLGKKLLLRLGIGKWHIGDYIKSMWREKIPFYAWKCSKCGQINICHLTGYKNILTCSHCAYN